MVHRFGVEFASEFTESVMRPNVSLEQTSHAARK
jgi:hypothetical protein